jgi:ADP-heptose:LPS heptosyltransferase
MKRILFITHTRIGDAVLSSALLAELTRRHPDARFTVACGPGPAGLFQAHPQLERLIVMRKRKRAGHWRSLWLQVAARRWYLVVDMRRSAMPWLVWTRDRATPPRNQGNEHRLVTMARTLSLDSPPQPAVWTSADDQRRADALLGHRRPRIVLAPTANWPAKVWPAENFAALVDRLTGPDGPLPGAQVVVTGGLGEEAQAQPVADAVPSERLVSAVGLDLGATAAVFQRCDLFVGNDSGLMHLAAAAGTPTVGLFGPTDDRIYAPRGPACRVVRTPESKQDLTGQPGFNHRTAGSQMGNLRVETVVTHAQGLLAELHARAPVAGT